METPSPPSALRILCPACSARGQQSVQEIAAGDEVFRCVRCRTRFRLITRFVNEARGGVDALGDYRYDLSTVEEGGRLRPRSVITVKRDARIQPRTWVTLVYRADRLVGIADQTNSQWYDILYRPPLPARYPAVWKAAYGACLLLAAIYALQWFKQLQDARAEQDGLMLIMVVLGVLALMPLAWWVLRAYTEDE